MTIEDFIRKFIFNLQLTHVETFTGPELYNYVSNEMKKHSRRYIEEVSVLRCLRKMRDRGYINYTTEGINNTIYRRG